VSVCVCLCVSVCVCVYLLLGGQFPYAVGLVERKVDHGLKQRSCFL